MPIPWMCARNASVLLTMMPNKTDRHEACGLAQIIRTGWFKIVQIKSHYANVNSETLTAHEALVLISALRRRLFQPDMLLSQKLLFLSLIDLGVWRDSAYD